MSTVAELQKRKQPQRRRVRITLDPDAEDAYVAALAAHIAAQRDADRRPDDEPTLAVLAEATAALDSARETLRAESHEFVFVSIGRKAFEALRDEHPATTAQKADFRDRMTALNLSVQDVGMLDHDPVTFPPALIAASCVDPVMTLEEAEDLWSSPVFSSSELAELFSTAQIANVQSRKVDLL